MHRVSVLAAVAAIATAGLVAYGATGLGTAAQDATPVALAGHPLVGTWVVDTIGGSDTDAPEIAVITADGGLAGLGANRVAGGRWQPIDDHAAELTLVTVFDNEEGAGYLVVRGPHTVDESGDAWTCDCTFTIVGADGNLLDSGRAPATGTRLPLQGVDMMGQPLAEVPTWKSALAVATPSS
jgi:hypothetical protein